MARPRVLTISALLILPLFLTGCGLKKNPSATATPTPSPITDVTGVTPTDTTNTSGATNLLTIDPTSINATLANNLATADAKTKAWRSNAFLAHVSVKIPADFAVGQATETYTYGSPSDGFNWWTVTISGKTNKVVRALIPKEDFLGTSYTEILKQFWKINYAEALQLAEVNGGSDYRAANPGTEVVASLAVSAPKNYLWWTIEYRSDSNVLKIFVNPASKEVVDAQGQSLTATAPSPSPSTTTATTTTPSPAATITPSDDEVLEE